MQYAYIGRKQKKETSAHYGFKELTLVLENTDMSYSTFMGGISKKGIALNRKVLADLAMNHPEAFKAVVDKVKS